MAQYGFGTGVLYGTRTDIPGATPIRFGVLQDISIDFNGEIKDLFGQYQFPVDSARGKTKISGKAKNAVINAGQFNNLFFGQTAATGQRKSVTNEAQTVSSTGSVTVANGSTFNLDLGVVYANTGVPLQFTVGAPTQAGQYSVNTATGQYTFFSTDEGANVLIDYLYTATTGTLVSGVNLLMGTTPRFTAVFTQSYGGNQTVMKLYSCTSSKLTMATKIDDYTIPELDFSAFANSGGQVFELSTS